MGQLLLAPMEGLLDHPLREVLTAAGGIDRCVSEFIRITDMLMPDRVFTRIVPELLQGGRTRAGGRWHRETHDFMSLPLYVAPGSVLPWGGETERPDYDYATGVTLRVFGLADGASAGFAVAAPSGAIAARGTVSRQGSQYSAQVLEGALQQWSIEVDGRRSPVLESGATR